MELLMLVAAGVAVLGLCWVIFPRQFDTYKPQQSARSRPMTLREAYRIVDTTIHYRKRLRGVDYAHGARKAGVRALLLGDTVSVHAAILHLELVLSEMEMKEPWDGVPFAA